MKFQGTVIEHQGIRFALVLVGEDVLEVPGRARDTIPHLQSVFQDMSIVLMARNRQGTPTYFGRPDIIAKMDDISMRGLEWKDYSVD